MTPAQRRRRALGIARFNELANRQPATAANMPAPPQDNAPTPERAAKGRFTTPKEGPRFDMHHDMIARLRAEGKLTQEQAATARAFIDLRAAFVAELGVRGYKSCLDASQAGYDASEGNAAIIRRYETLRAKIGRIKTALLTQECDKDSAGRPYDLQALRTALDVAREWV